MFNFYFKKINCCQWCSYHIAYEWVLWDLPKWSLHITYYNFAWVPRTFGGVWPLLALPYFAHWSFSSIYSIVCHCWANERQGKIAVIAGHKARVIDVQRPTQWCREPDAAEVATTKQFVTPSSTTNDAIAAWNASAYVLVSRRRRRRRKQLRIARAAGALDARLSGTGRPQFHRLLDGARAAWDAGRQATLSAPSRRLGRSPPELFVACRSGRGPSAPIGRRDAASSRQQARWEIAVAAQFATLKARRWSSLHGPVC